MNLLHSASRYQKTLTVLILLPLAAQAQEFDLEGPVTAAWSELISAGAGNEGVQGLRDWPGANRLAVSGDGAVVYSYVNGSVTFSSMNLQARNAGTGEVLWQITPCPAVDWHDFNVCMIEDLELTDDGATLIVAGRKEVSTEFNVRGSRTDQAWIAAVDTGTGDINWQTTTDFGGQLLEPVLAASYVDLGDSRVLLAADLRVGYLGGTISTGAFAGFDLLTGAEQWNARVGTSFNDEFKPNDAAVSSDQATWFVSGIADAEVWPCDSQGNCGPHPTVKNYTNAFGLVAIDVLTGELTDLSERSLPEDQYDDAKAFGLALSDDGQYLYQVGTAAYERQQPEWIGQFFTTRILIRLASATENHAVVHDAVHATFPLLLIPFGNPPDFGEAFNFCDHGQVAAGAGRLYWHYECSNSETGAQGSVVTALDRDTWSLSWESVQHSDQEWADDLVVLPDGNVLASGGTWDQATDQLNGFMRGLDPGSGEQVFRAQYQAFENPLSAGQERIHDIAASGGRMFGRVSMGNSSVDNYQLIALESAVVGNENEFHLRCYHEPLWPQDGDSVTIVMEPKRFPLDGNPFVVDRKELWLNVSDQPVVFTEDSPPYTLSYETGPLTAGEQFTYGCRTIKDDASVFSGWRTATVGVTGPSAAVPVSFSGPSSDRIDIVFVADTDTYNGPADPVFLEHANQMFRFIFEDEFFTRYQHMFNFWIAQTTGSADSEKDADDEYIRIIVKPHDWDTNYAFADVGVIIHADNFRDFAKGGFFTSTRGSAGVSRHEAGHRPFGLSDEYCCDGGYHDMDFFPNIYTTLESCEADAPDLGRNPSACRSWVSQFSDITYYTSEPASDDLMKDNRKANAADVRRIEWLLGKCLVGEC